LAFWFLLELPGEKAVLREMGISVGRYRKR
jgi:hypothetical protein